jgi:type IV pilus assembly protein PilN
MRITLNLASHPYVELRPLYQRLRALSIGLAVSALLLGWLLSTQLHRARQARAAAASLDGQIASTEQGRSAAEASMRQPQNAAVLAQAHFLNNLFLHKSFSWTAVMMDLEQVLPDRVQVLTLDPAVAKDGTVTIHMRVAGPREQAVALVRNLEHSRRFRAPRIVAETAEAQDQNGRPGMAGQATTDGVNFDVLAEYNPLEPEEAAKPQPAAAHAAPRRKPGAARSTP